VGKLVGAVQAVGGNTAMSILLTVSSNIAGVFTMPLILQLMLATSCALKFDALKLVIGLAPTVLLPLLIGAALRGVTWVRASALLNPLLSIEEWFSLAFLFDLV
jgi:predicted Na+-dependent transporter